MLRFHRTYYFLTIVFLFLRVRSRTLCAQWTCHVFSRLGYLVFPFPVSRATGSCTHTFPFPSYVFPFTCTTVLIWIVDSSSVTCLFPISPFVSMTRPLTFLAYVFLLLSRRLVYAYRYRLCLSFCSSSTCLLSRYFWTLTCYRVIFLCCIFVLVSRILPIYTGWRWDCSPSSIYFATTLKV